MKLVVTCTMCGLVNEGTARTCVDCGTRLSNLRFYRPHLQPGMRQHVTRVEPSMRIINRPPGTEIRTPEGELVYLRPAWGTADHHWRSVEAEDVADEVAGAAWDLGLHHRAGAIAALIIYPFVWLVAVVASLIRVVDQAGRTLFEAIGHFVFMRPWIIKVYRGNPARVYRTFRVRGYRRAGKVIDELAIAYQVGDLGFVPTAVRLP